VANVVDPYLFPGVSALGFENHLNVFHAGKKKLTKNFGIWNNFVLKHHCC
jgi:hypothetical protein